VPVEIVRLNFGAGVALPPFVETSAEISAVRFA
jgi:hypothetical protein